MVINKIDIHFADFLFMEASNTLIQLKKETRPIVIFGAGVAGEALFYACRDFGIDVTCFCDNNTNKTGQRLCGLPIVPISEIEKKWDQPVFLISAADINDVVIQLERGGHQNWHDTSQLLHGFDATRYDLSVPSGFAEYVVSTCCFCHQAYRNRDAIFLRSVDIVITERCSLRCRDCANLMQYYKNPENYSLEDISRGVNALSKMVDSVNEVRVIGGEPLMSPVFKEVIEMLIGYPEFRRVIIYTNGTICPSKESLKSLQHPKVLFFITNYGTLSKNIERLKRHLDELGIQRYVQSAEAWSQCSSMKKQNRDEPKMKEVFGNCCAKHTVTLIKGHLFRCPFSANATTLHAIPFTPLEAVSIVEKKSQDMKTLRRRVLKLLTRQYPLCACDYCEGRPFGAPEITPAVQVRYPLEYQKIR